MKRDGPWVLVEMVTAFEFLDYLQLNASVWDVGDRTWGHEWLFRGQSASDPLVPTIWRTNKSSLVMRMLAVALSKRGAIRERKLIGKLLKTTDRYRGVAISTSELRNWVSLYYRTSIEIQLLDRLARQARYRGTLVPDYDKLIGLLIGLNSPQAFVDLALADFGHGLDDFIGAAVNNSGLVAIAQHHGIPTRLLDWTTSQYVAAYFAAEGVADKLVRGEKLTSTHVAVFAVHEGTLRHRNILPYPLPISDDPYLIAQRGRLTLHEGSRTFLWSGKFPSIDDRLTGDDRWDGQEDPPIKVTLPVSEVPKLLRLLARNHGISRDLLMPNMDSIVKTVNQQYALDILV